MVSLVKLHNHIALGVKHVALVEVFFDSFLDIFFVNFLFLL